MAFVDLRQFHPGHMLVIPRLHLSQSFGYFSSCGLTLIATCTDFDEATLPSADKPEIQFVLER